MARPVWPILVGREIRKSKEFLNIFTVSELRKVFKRLWQNPRQDARYPSPAPSASALPGAASPQPGGHVHDLDRAGIGPGALRRPGTAADLETPGSRSVLPDDLPESYRRLRIVQPLRRGQALTCSAPAGPAAMREGRARRARSLSPAQRGSRPPLSGRDKPPEAGPGC